MFLSCVTANCRITDTANTLDYWKVMELPDYVSENMGRDVIRDFLWEVLQKHQNNFNVHPSEFMNAAECINEAYNPRVMTPFDRRIPLDFNSAAFRCVYLHKYAIHAAAVRYFFSQNREVLKTVLEGSDGNNINVCCLGGGPGSDAIGFSAEFCNFDESAGKRFNFTIVDSMSGWEFACDDMFNVCDPEKYGKLGEFLSSRVSHSFICGDLLDPSRETNLAIENADVITLVKIVSALDPYRASRILEDVFRRMKPGALVVFVDNSGGGSHETMQDAADKCGLEEIGNSFRHIKYENLNFCRNMNREYSRTDIAVAMKMFKKKPETN